MNTVIISPKFQIVIPLEVRKFFKIQPGEKLQVVSYGNRIELIPVKKMRDMRGFVKGMKTCVNREDDRV